jgi:hypothetical protein
MLPGQEYDLKEAIVSGGMLSICFSRRRLNGFTTLGQFQDPALNEIDELLTRQDYDREPVA